MSQTITSGWKPCVYCGEQIRRDAKKCRYCGEWFDTSEPTSSPTPPATPGTRTSGRAIASFLFAVLGGGLGAIPAMVLSRQAEREIKGSDGSVRGKGWAQAGYWLGFAQLCVISIILVMILAQLTDSGPPPPPATPDGPVRVRNTENVFSVSVTKEGDRATFAFLVREDALCSFSLWATANDRVYHNSYGAEAGYNKFTWRNPRIQSAQIADISCRDLF